MFSFQYTSRKTESSWAPVKKPQNRKPLANITNSTRNTSCQPAENNTRWALPEQECEPVEYQPEFDDMIIDDDTQFFEPCGTDW